MSTKPIPEGHYTVTPYFAIKGALKALEFYKKALGATEVNRMLMPDGRLGHAEIRVGNSRIMLAEVCQESGGKGAKELGGCPVHMYLYVEDSDAFFKKAVSAGAKEVKPVEDQFYGDRAGAFEDPFGHTWWVATHKEDVAPEEMARRMEEMMAAKK